MRRMIRSVASSFASEAVASVASAACAVHNKPTQFTESRNQPIGSLIAPTAPDTILWLVSNLR